MDGVEQVGCIARGRAQELGLLAHGFTRRQDAGLLVDIEASLGFVERGQAETNPDLKQIIPYVVVRQSQRVLIVERLTGGGERRLHGKLSLGIGGHINPIDGPSAGEPTSGLVARTRDRELAEDLWLDGVAAIDLLGTINDDTSAVGAVHLGVVFGVRLATGGTVSVREVDALHGSLLPWIEVVPLAQRLETWSAFLLDAHHHGQLD
jgi:predicted NUDIX family phosphoesterase